MEKKAPTIIKYKLTKEQRSQLDLEYFAAKYDLFFFSKVIMGRDWLVPRVHGPLCDFLSAPYLASRNYPITPLYPPDYEGEITGLYEYETLPGGTKKNPSTFQLILMPRKSFKTTLVGECLPMWILKDDPTQRILIGGENEPMAIKTLDVIGQRCRNAKKFRYLYGDWETNSFKWQKTEKFIAGTRKHPGSGDYIPTGEDRTPSLVAAGVGSPVTSLHPRCLIFDDIWTLEASRSTKKAEQVDSFFSEALRTLIPPALVWMIGTRWGFNDVYSKLLDKKKNKGWGRYVRAMKLPNGEYWLPEHLTEEKLAAEWSTMSNYDIMCQYYMRPVRKSERSLDYDSVQWYAPDDAPKRERMTVFVGIDPAGSREAGDWAIPVVGATADQHIWVLDEFKEPCTTRNATLKVLEMVNRYSPEAVIVEASAISTSWITDTLKPEMEKAAFRVPIIEATTHGISKESRITGIGYGLQNLIEAKRFHVADNMRNLKVELANFPSDLTFDLLDSIAYILQEVLRTHWFPDSPTPILEDSGNPELKQVMERMAWFYEQNCERQQELEFANYQRVNEQIFARLN